MSELHLPPSGNHAMASVEDANEVLTEAQQTLLGQRLGQAPLPHSHADFNAVVLAAMQSGQDFETAAEQTKTRLRWAALPAVIGFVLMYSLACWQACTLPRPPVPYPRVNHGQPAPPLPDLPILPPQGKSAFLNGKNEGHDLQNVSQAAASHSSIVVAAVGGPHHAR